jgi:hypothetical protein
MNASDKSRTIRPTKGIFAISLLASSSRPLAASGLRPLA